MTGATVAVEIMGDSLENNNLEQNSDDHSTSTVDISTFLPYLKKVVTLLLQEENEDISGALSTALEDRSHVEAIRKFLSDSQFPSLFIQRGITKGTNIIINAEWCYVRISQTTLNLTVFNV